MCLDWFQYLFKLLRLSSPGLAYFFLPRFIIIFPSPPWYPHRFPLPDFPPFTFTSQTSVWLIIS
ncbi:hypothetical protein PAXRUDRAFT_821022 [Paxillus rubicundulus Ve08.2h10]|uniref:Uncharacterized protein n=1 Tax=Paxillus rubicundulus Ve08.2h10 TaxID=930991 RepID=A0A0D0EDF2_9AGAM|nr:hypothetical protein PAXRUDRAFT_821022 [Paxillus rubicundulus Ve08.2h10]